MSDSDRFFPHVKPRTDGRAALERFRRAHEGHASQMEEVERLGAQVLVSAAVVLGVDPVTLGFGLRDGQLASALTAGEPLVSSEIAERRLEIAIACIAGWAEELARTVRREGDRQATRLDRLAGDVRQEWGRMQHLLYREGTIRQTRPFSRAPEPAATTAADLPGPDDGPAEDVELALRERIAALVLKLERNQVSVSERDCTIERLEDDRLRLRARVQELEQECSRLQRAVAGWKREAGVVQRRRARREAEVVSRHHREMSHITGLDDLEDLPTEESLGASRDIHADPNGSAQPRWMADTDVPTDPEPPQS